MGAGGALLRGRAGKGWGGFSAVPFANPVPTPLGSWQVLGCPSLGAPVGSALHDPRASSQHHDLGCQSSKKDIPGAHSHPDPHPKGIPVTWRFFLCLFQAPHGPFGTSLP